MCKSVCVGFVRNSQEAQRQGMCDLCTFTSPAAWTSIQRWTDALAFHGFYTTGLVSNTSGDDDVFRITLTWEMRRSVAAFYFPVAIAGLRCVVHIVKTSRDTLKYIFFGVGALDPSTLNTSFAEAHSCRYPFWSLFQSTHTHNDLYFTSTASFVKSFVHRWWRVPSISRRPGKGWTQHYLYCVSIDGLA